ncbi:hypothetical protein [Microbacterium sp. APC 3901]|uniref:hypothetical protein n=1 Tax=Microbacterium sp. APC 3901 TaxID=3035192 RepID=UPI0025B28DEB|nr:hypothetical protein [Microbacterium sp. APC 3901]MDN3443755.1 hypothetical protein [Microbacterium sp. APC 3901]
MTTSNTHRREVLAAYTAGLLTLDAAEQDDKTARAHIAAFISEGGDGLDLILHLAHEAATAYGALAAIGAGDDDWRATVRAGLLALEADAALAEVGGASDDQG